VTFRFALFDWAVTRCYRLRTSSKPAVSGKCPDNTMAWSIEFRFACSRSADLVSLLAFDSITLVFVRTGLLSLQATK